MSNLGPNFPIGDDSPRKQKLGYMRLPVATFDNESMAAELISGITDDNDFIELLNSMVRGLLVQQTPDQLWIVQIDNWFDHKWLRFSGLGAAASDIPVTGYETVKREFYQDKLTFPPFAPDRVLGQWSYIRRDDDYREAPLPKLPHATEKRPTNLNLQRRIKNLDGSACFLWYSSNTLVNGRGSAMVYTVSGETSDCWFASFNRKGGWALGETKGINRTVVLEFLT
ncbi:MAG: hypothetical protein P4L03_02700 [Terracidiphilus sp.]|nr:hypothetical protein [Terracidiphilus sp.]